VSSDVYCQSVWIKPGGKCKIVFLVTALNWFDVKKEQFHCVTCLVDACFHTSDISSQSVALVVLVQPSFVIWSSAFALCCSCLDVSFAFQYVCYVQLQCTFSNVYACVRACACGCIYMYIQIYIYIYYLFVSLAFVTCSQNAVNLLHFYYKNYVNGMHNELWWTMWI
jgi:hypothetical protein